MREPVQLKMELKTELTPDDKARLGLELAETVTGVQKLEDELKTVKSNYKARLDKAAEDIADISRRIRQGWELREVDVEQSFDEENKICSFTRIDSGEIFETRAMTASELQGELPYTEDADDEPIDDEPVDLEFNDQNPQSTHDFDAAEAAEQNDAEQDRYDDGGEESETETVTAPKRSTGDRKKRGGGKK